MKPYEAIDTYINGNISDFKKWLKKCSKLDMLNAIEYASGEGTYRRHQVINQMRLYLEEGKR